MVGFGHIHKAQQRQEWAAFYVNYDLLKQKLDAVIQFPGTNTTREYLQVFRDEWNKARMFAMKLDDMATTPAVEIATFCSQNRLALLKAGKKFSKHAPAVNLMSSLGDFRGDRLGFDETVTFFIERRLQEFKTEREAYGREMYQDMENLGLPLPSVSKAKKGDEIDASLVSVALPESFERESSKFWLQRQHVVGFIDLVSKRLGPYKFKEQKDVYNIITSLYLDNDAFDLYASRVARRDGAQLVRIRWYSEQVEKHESNVISPLFVEVKTHREPWTGEKSKKERFDVPWNRMTDWLQGRWQPKKESSQILAASTLATIKRMSLQPKVMTQYRRFVFQRPETSFLRISMDSRLELGGFTDKNMFTADWNNREPVTWTRSFPANMICEFPFVVVELKTECAFSDAPQWMKHLTDSSQSPLRDTDGKFSKYGTGVALMFYSAVRDLVELPQPMLEVYPLCSLEEREFLVGPGGLFKQLASGAQQNQQDDVSDFFSLAQASSPPPRTPARQSDSRAHGSFSGSGDVELQDINSGPRDTVINIPQLSPSPARNSLGAAFLGGSGSASAYQPQLCKHTHQRYAYSQFDEESGGATAARVNVGERASSCLPKRWVGFGRRAAPGKKTMREKKVEPKILFANERTYLQWMQAGVLLTTLSLGLLTLEGESSNAGFFMAPIALLVMGWSTVRYYIRAKAVERNQKDGYFDPYGPPVLASLLSVVIILQLIDTFKKARQ